MANPKKMKIDAVVKQEVTSCNRHGNNEDYTVFTAIQSGDKILVLVNQKTLPVYTDDNDVLKDYVYKAGDMVNEDLVYCNHLANPEELEAFFDNISHDYHGKIHGEPIESIDVSFLVTDTRKDIDSAISIDFHDGMWQAHTFNEIGEEEDYDYSLCATRSEAIQSIDEFWRQEQERRDAEKQVDT